jgi:hypothetical protein
MVDLIQDRTTAEEKEQQHNIFSRLLDANDEEGMSGGAKLSTRELLGALLHYLVHFILLYPGALGNMFIFQLAGHEVRSPTFIFRFP